MTTKLSRAKRLVINISKPIGILFLIISGIAVAMGLLVDGEDIYDKYFQPKIEMKFDKSGPIALGTEVNLSFSVPDHGFYSLWNLTGKGEVKRILPDEDSNLSAIAISSLNKTGERWLKPNERNSKEEMLLLWTKDHGDHPSRVFYPTEGEFRQYIDIHSSYGWKEKIAKIQVR